MKGLNKATLLGNLGNKPEYQVLEGNLPLAKFTLATSDTFKDKEGKTQTTTEWHNIVLWRGLAETAHKYLHKGSSVYIEGKIKTRSYEDKDNNKKYVTEIVAEELILLDRKARGEDKSQPDPDGKPLTEGDGLRKEWDKQHSPIAGNKNKDLPF